MILAAASTTEIIAIAAAGAGGVALAGLVVLALVLRSIRATQRAVVGESGTRDVVAYAARLERDTAVLRDYLEDVAARLDVRLRRSEGRLDHAVTRRAVVHYDAYGEMSGRQSLSLALVDSSKSGVVLSSILHRDAARLYVKEIREGRGEPMLSPEEEEALRLALAQDA